MGVCDMAKSLDCVGVTRCQPENFAQSDLMGLLYGLKYPYLFVCFGKAFAF
jgi:hypothetical protein